MGRGRQGAGRTHKVRANGTDGQGRFSEVGLRQASRRPFSDVTRW